MSLHVLTALHGKMAVVLRRGPSAWTSSHGWNRATGAVETGQWLHGRIYEHRCDLSPDGRHLVYFATKGGSTFYTALSRAPWLKALRLWPEGDTWGGGGAFVPDGSLWLNSQRLKPQEWLPKGMGKAPPDAFPGTTDGFFGGGLVAARLALRGWTAEGSGCAAVLKRPLWHGWSLVRWFENVQGQNVATPRHALERGSDLLLHPDWQWAEPLADRLQFADLDKLHSAELGEDGLLTDLQTVHDFSGLVPTPQPAPKDAHDRQAPLR